MPHIYKHGNATHEEAYTSDSTSSTVYAMCTEGDCVLIEISVLALIEFWAASL